MHWSAVHGLPSSHGRPSVLREQVSDSGLGIPVQEPLRHSKSVQVREREPNCPHGSAKPPQAPQSVHVGAAQAFPSVVRSEQLRVSGSSVAMHVEAAQVNLRTRRVSVPVVAHESG
jgi:hypothetical protein